MGVQLVFAQTVKFDSKIIHSEYTVKDGARIPIEVTVQRGKGTIYGKLTILQLGRSSGMDSPDYAIIPASMDVKLDGGKSADRKATYTFYLIISKDGAIKTPESITLQAVFTPVNPRDPSLTSAIMAAVTIRPFTKVVQSLNDYLGDASAKLDHVSRVEALDQSLTIFGTKDNYYQVYPRKVKLQPTQIYVVKEKSTLRFGWNPVKHLSLLTIPIKTRPTVIGSRRNSSAGLTNIGLNADLVRWSRDHYLWTGRKSNHRIGFGVLVAPAVEEFDGSVTGGAIPGTSKSKQLFVSTALTLTYTYNNLSFALVPRGWDFGTSAIGKDWVYHKKRWWGFGIGIDPKLFSALLK